MNPSNAGTCFLCLKKAKVAFGSKYNEEAGVWFCFKRVFKFLKIKSLQNTNASENIYNVEDFVAFLCASCASVSVNLSKLCQELEVILMKINHSVESMQQLITTNLDFGQTSNSQGDVYSVLRDTIQEKCTEISQSQVPRVVLQKYQSKTTSVQNDDKSENVAETAELEETEVVDSNLSNTCFDISQQQSVLLVGSASDLKVKIDTHEAKNDPDKFFCSVCCQHFAKLDFLWCHQASKHPETYFTSADFPNLSPAQFEMLCQHFMEQQTELFKNRNNETDTINYICPYCSEQLKGIAYAPNHLVTNHGVLLAQKLKLFKKTNSNSDSIISAKLNLQTLESESTKLSEENLTEPHQNLSSGLHKCTFCNQMFLSRPKLRCHQAEHHMTNYFQTSKRIDITDDQFQKYCTYLQKDELLRFRHFRNLSGNYIYQCSYCNYKTFDFQNTRVHLIHNHQEIVTEKLELLQNCTRPDELPTKLLVLKQKSKGRRIFDLMKSNETPTKILELRKKQMESKRQCSVCLMRCKSINTHRAKYHPELYLESYRHSTTTQKNFQKYCMLLIHQELSLCKRISDKPCNFRSHYLYSCHFCSKFSSPLAKLPLHLVTVHNVALGRKLELLQKNVLPENLTKLEISGDCRLGALSKKMVQNISSNTSTGNSHQCSKCEKSYTNARNLRCHQSHKHPEQFLLSYKTSDQSMEEFHTKCLKVITQQVNLFTRTKYGTKLYLICCHCGNRFRELGQASNHLLQWHEDIVTSKLNVNSPLEINLISPETTRDSTQVLTDSDNVFLKFSERVTVTNPQTGSFIPEMSDNNLQYQFGNVPNYFSMILTQPNASTIDTMQLIELD